MNAFGTSLVSAVAVTVFGQVLYHIVAKGTSSRSPFEIVSVAYFTGLLFVSIMGLALNKITFNTISDAETLRVGALLGVAVSLVELGYIFAYRAGLPINVGALSVLAVTTVALAPLGLVFFSETITLRLILGCAMTIGGLWIMLGN